MHVWQRLQGNMWGTSRTPPGCAGAAAHLANQSSMADRWKFTPVSTSVTCVYNSNHMWQIVASRSQATCMLGTWQQPRALRQCQLNEAQISSSALFCTALSSELQQLKQLTGSVMMSPERGHLNSSGMSPSMPPRGDCSGDAMTSSDQRLAIEIAQNGE